MSALSQEAVDALFRRVTELEKGNAVTMDRTGRHDDEIRAITGDVKTISAKVTTLEATVTSGFREVARAHDQLMDSNMKVSASLEKLHSEVANNSVKRIEISTVVKVAVWLVPVLVAVGGVAAKYIGGQ